MTTRSDQKVSAVAGTTSVGEIRRWCNALRSFVSWHTVPRGLRVSHTLGAVLLTLCGLQVVTGILLLFYYQPTPERAYESVVFVMNDVTWGWAVRSLHRWAGEAMVIVLALHLCRVFFAGAFKQPREATWLVGSCLLLSILGLLFTGYLLPWDQKAYWGTTIAAQMAHQVPVLGDFIAAFMKGGKQVGAATLTRFFALHVVVLPAALAVLIVLHVGLVYRLGIAAPLSRRKGGSATPGGIPYVQFLRSEILAGLLVMAGLFFWTAWYPAGLGLAADPAVTPEHIKPDWPFLAFYQSLKYFPSGNLFPGFAYLQLAVLVQGLPFLLILLVPFLDRSVHRRPFRRKWATGIALSIILLWAVLTYLGHYAGGREPIFGLKVQ